MLSHVHSVLVIDLPCRTKLIDDANRPNPQYRGLIHGTATIVRQEGLAGIYRGLFPVVSIIAWFNINSTH